MSMGTFAMSSHVFNLEPYLSAFGEDYLISTRPFPADIPTIPTSDSTPLSVLRKRARASSDTVNTKNPAKLLKETKTSAKHDKTRSTPKAPSSMTNNGRCSPLDEQKKKKILKLKHRDDTARSRAKANRLLKTLMAILPSPNNKNKIKTKVEKLLYAMRRFSEIQLMIVCKKRELAWTSRQALSGWLRKELSTTHSFKISLRVVVKLFSEQTRAESAAIWQPMTPNADSSQFTQTSRWSKSEGWSSPPSTYDYQDSGGRANNERAFGSQSFHRAFSSLVPLLLLDDDWDQLTPNEMVNGTLTIPIIAREKVCFVVAMHVYNMNPGERRKMMEYSRMISAGLWNTIEAPKLLRKLEKLQNLAPSEG